MQPFDQTTIWDQFRNGDEKALFTLYNYYYDDLLKYGWRLWIETETIKEIINELFASLWENRHKLPAVGNLKAYLFTCFRHKWLRRVKRSGPSIRAIDDTAEYLLPAAASVEETIIGIQEYEQLHQKVLQLLSLLTERQQFILKMRFLEEMSYEEIASALDISVRTVYNSIHESIKVLKQYRKK